MEEENNKVDENKKYEDKEDVNEFHTLGYKLHDAYLDHGAVLASSYLQMPSGLKTFDNVKWSCPRVCMDLLQPDDMHCLDLMMSCAHKNILHAKIVTAEDSCNVAWTEPFTGLLITLLKQMKSNLGDSTGMVPSAHLQIIVSQWFDGIGHLIHCGKYHGDFRLENTYYHMASGFPVVKFTNFRVKAIDGKSLIDYQLEDVWAIARGLDEICTIAEQCNRAGRRPTLDCCLVIDLAKKLREISKENLVSVMKDIRKHMFFWDKDDRTRFYVYDLPSALRSTDLIDDIEASNTICTIPWDADQYCGLLRDMNDYRALCNKPSYDGTKKSQFCAFCSGLYTHEPELPGVKFGGLMVDNVLQCSNPKACFEIVSLMPNGEKKYMLSKREVKK